MPKYKNVSGRNLELPGIGIVKADGITEQPDGFNNANFEKVEGAKPKEIPEKEERESSWGKDNNPPGRKTKHKTKE